MECDTPISVVPASGAPMAPVRVTVCSLVRVCGVGRQTDSCRVSERGPGRKPRGSPRWCGLAIVALVALCGATTPSAAIARSTDEQRSTTRYVALELYVNTDDESSGNVSEVVAAFVKKRNGVQYRTVDLASDPAGAERLERIAKALHLKNPQPPLVYGCNRVVAGAEGEAAIRGNLQAMLRIEVFVRAGCPRCASAKSYLPKIAKKYPGFEIKILEITSDAAARSELERLTRMHRTQAASVPVFHLCNQLIVGFDREETSGRRLEEVLDHWTLPAEREDPRLSSTGPRRRKLAPTATYRLGDHSGPLAGLALITAFPLTSSSALGQAVDTNGPRTQVSYELPAEANEYRFRTGQQTDSTDELPLPIAASDSEPSDEIEVPFFGKLSVRSLGLPLFTLVIGLVDGFNPCAMWVLVFLLSVLVNLHDRWKILAVAGSFVCISGLAYLAFMAAWLNVFVFVGLLRPVQVTLGLLAIFVGSVHVKDFFAFKKGVTLSIPESAKPGIYEKVRRIVGAENLLGAVIGACTLAILVNIIELLCTAGLPALYTEVLAVQQYPVWKNYLYLGLYIVAYMFDDTVMVGIVVITLGRHKMQETHGRWLKLISGLVILSLGLVMLIHPDWLV